MALKEAEQVHAVRLMANHITNPALAASIIEATGTREAETELRLLTYIVGRGNILIASPKKDPELQNIAQLQHPLPVPFAWEDRNERIRWTRSLRETFPIMDAEIGPFYKPPGALETHAFRFYLLDEYARWVVTNMEPERDLERDREASNYVINAVCETAVVLAEQGRAAVIKLVRWMNKIEWLEQKWGFTPEFVRRAHVFQPEK